VRARDNLWHVNPSYGHSTADTVSDSNSNVVNPLPFAVVLASLHFVASGHALLGFSAHT
jgi:hypothetical protein